MYYKSIGKAFVVEDDPYDQVALSYAASKLGVTMEMEAYTSGQFALEEIARFFERHPGDLPSVFILDIALLDFTGELIFDALVATYGALSLSVPPIMFLTVAETEAALARTSVYESAILCRKPADLHGWKDVFLLLARLAEDQRFAS